MKQGFGIIQLTVLEGADFRSARRILVTAVATAENTGMQWKDVNRDSVGSQWGRAPSLVEGVPAKIRLLPSQAWKAWTLDECGQRREAVPLQDNTLEIAPVHKTLSTSWSPSNPKGDCGLQIEFRGLPDSNRGATAISSQGGAAGARKQKTPPEIRNPSNPQFFPIAPEPQR